MTNLGQSANKAVEQAGGQNTNGMDDVRKMVKEGKKKLNELQKTVKSVDYSSSRYRCIICYIHFSHVEFQTH